MTDTDLEQRLRDLSQADLPPSSTRPAIDTSAAWRDFQALRSRSVTMRRRSLVVAVIAAVAALAIAFPEITGTSNVPRPQPVTSTAIPASPHTYPKAVVARIPLSHVMAVVGHAGHAWAVRAIEQPGLATTYQLVGIDLQTNSIMFRTHLGKQLPSIAAGDGRLWLTTRYGQARGQIDRVDLATGQVLNTIRLPARPCSQIAFAAAKLFAACGLNGAPGTQIWRIDPVSERARRLARPQYGHVFSLVATPDSVWNVGVPDVVGLVDTGGRSRTVHLTPGHQVVAGTRSVVYGDGSVWVLSDGERLARFDPRTGRLLKRYTYRNYDPRRAGGLDFLTAGGGWLWFIDNGYPFSGVLRVSESTGRPGGGVRIAPNSCGQVVCSQIFYAPGSVWVPTAELLIRIDTSRMPG
jgi:outer membrane protein assembly factor BamB